MRGKDLLECMEQIDDALVEEALEPAAFPRTKDIVAKWVRFPVPCLTGSVTQGQNKAAKWGMAAACVVVVGISAAAFWSHQNMKEARIGSQDTDTAYLQMVVDSTAGNDNGGAGGAAAGAAVNGAVTAGAGGDAEGNAVSEDAGASRQSSAEDAEASKDSVAETAKSEEKLKKLTDGNDGAVTESLSYIVIGDYYGEKDASVYDYPIPEKGKFFCYHYLQETMNYYAALENVSEMANSSVNMSGTSDSPIYVYDVVIDIYGAVEKDSEVIYCDLINVDGGSEKIEQEYRRLIELGYAVRLSEDFQLTGTFTKVELDTFQASPEYGYSFRFSSE